MKKLLVKYLVCLIIKLLRLVKINLINYENQDQYRKEISDYLKILSKNLDKIINSCS